MSSTSGFSGTCIVILPEQAGTFDVYARATQSRKYGVTDTPYMDPPVIATMLFFLARRDCDLISGHVLKDSELLRALMVCARTALRPHLPRGCG
jgi:hypothetical protein